MNNPGITTNGVGSERGFAYVVQHHSGAYEQAQVKHDVEMGALHLFF